MTATKRQLTLAAAALAATIFTLPAALRQPQHSGEWQSPHMRLPNIAFNATGDRFIVTNLRDFRYHPDRSVRKANYLNKEYRLNELRRVWLGISHFGANGMAHTLLSFEFANGHYLVLSVEARMRPEQSYHPLRGLLRHYPKMIVLGSEEDIIGLRSHIRGERLLLYPLTLDVAESRYLLRAMLTDVVAIEKQPTFYNTVLDNCTTTLLRHDPDHRLWRGLFDYRILLPGYGDDYALERGWIDNGHPIEKWRESSRIDAEISPEVNGFSDQIRQRVTTTAAAANAELSAESDETPVARIAAE